MADKGNPLIEAMPPATDYLTYLTLIEYNLTPENLGTLHEVLQDPKLTTNIGWDLVHLLLPLLPASEPCLQDVARLGNPREVVLKVTEALRLIELNRLDSDELEEDAGAANLERVNIKGKGKGPAIDPVGSNSTQSQSSQLPHSVQRFQSLLSMLSVLHPRIKTKYPTRFLSTSLQAALASYSEAEVCKDELTLSVVTFIKTISGTRRPHLPPRASGGSTLQATSQGAAPDPEEQAEGPSPDEMKLQKRLLQSFATHVLEEYMLSLSSIHDVPGLAWTSRLQERLQPERIIPGKPTYAEKFASEDDLVSRSSVVGQVAALARDLDLGSEVLYAAIIDPKNESTGLPGGEVEPPDSAEDVPLSKTGCLFLFTARKVREILFESTMTSSAVPIFPNYAELLQNFIGGGLSPSIGMENEALIDSLLALGIIALEGNQVGEPEDDEQFNKFLQTTSLLSANNPSPTLRYQAHYLTSTVLRSHPSDNIRLSFIRDTLEHCPFENLKASAVGWLKGETIEANLVPRSAAESGSAGSDWSIFATPIALSTLSPYLFPDLTQKLTNSSLSETWTQFKLDLSFYLAALNFYFLLLTAEQLHEPLDIPGLHETGDIGGSYLSPLRDVVGKFRKGLVDSDGTTLGELGQEEGEEGVVRAMSDLQLLEDVLRRVEEGVEAMNGDGK